MYTPQDISDMPESEVPWEFLVDAPERRRQGRRDDNHHETPCVGLVAAENRLERIAQELHNYRRDHQKEIEKASSEREEIIAKLDKIDSHLDRQKGFFAGVVWLGAGMISLAGIIEAVANFLKEH